MKKTSFLIAVLMIVQMLFTVSPVMAEGTVIDSDYTPLAISYSSEANVYVMAAKNLTATAMTAKTTPMKIYTSRDGVEWTYVKSFSSAYTQQNPQISQILTYWASAKVFVLAVGNKVYTSEKGNTWTECRTFGNPVVVSSNGNKLFVGWFNKIGIYNNITELISKTATASADNQWIMYIMPSENGCFAINRSTQWGGYRWVVTENEDETLASKRLRNVNNNYGYSASKIAGRDYAVMTIASSPKLIVTSTAIDEITEVSVKVSDNGAAYENTEIINSVLYSDGKIFAATEKGSIYYTDVVSSNPTSSTVWNKVSGVSAEDSVYAMTEGKDGTILAAGLNTTYAIIKDGNGYTKIDVTAPVIYFNNSDSVEAPVSGTVEMEIKPVLKTYLGADFNGTATLTVSGSLPSGVTFTPVTQENSGDTAGILTVTSEVKDPVSVTLKAKSGISEKDTVINILAENEINIIGEDKIIIPDYGEEADDYTYTYEILNQNGTQMAREAEFSISSLPDNVTFDSLTGKLTVPYTASEGTAVLKAVSKSKPSLYKEINIVFELNKPERIEIDESLNIFKVSDSSNVSLPLIAKVYNKTGDIISSNILQWSVKDINGRPLAGVTVNNDTKTAVFAAGFSESSVVIRAEAIGYSNVYSEALAVVLYNDEKVAEEDLKNIVSKYDFTNLENDVILKSNGDFGSIVSWQSSDESVITSRGVINKESEARSTSMTVTVIYGNAKAVHTFPVSLGKYINLIKNGNFESGITEPWTGNAVITDSDVNEGSHSAEIADKISQTVSLKQEHIYALSAYVKAETSSNVKITLNGVNTAELNAGNSYKMISEIYSSSANGSYTFELRGDSKFYADDIKLYDITDEYKAAEAAVLKAMDSRLKTDKKYAESLVSQLVNSSEKEAFISNLGAVSLIEYEEIALGAYSFVSAAYNKNDNILTVVAKNFTTDENPGRIYTSYDGGATWSLALSVNNAKNSNHNDTKQVITYWEKQNSFVAILGSKVYYSQNGLSWTEIPELETNSGYIVSNGDKLFVAGSRAGKSATDLSGAYIEVNTNAKEDYRSSYATVSDSGYGFYQQLSVGTSYPTTVYYVKPNSETGELTSTGAWPVAYGLVSDVVYVPEISKWILTTSNTASYRFLTEPSSLTGEHTVTDDTKTAGYTTALYDFKKLYVANKEGKIFVGDASDTSKVTGWQEITCTTPLDSEASAMVKLANGDILVFSQKDIYTLKNNVLTQSQKNYEIGFNEELRFEVPLIGEKTYSFTAYSRLYDGSKTPYGIVSVKPVTALPDGIVFKGYDYVDENTPVCEFIVSDYTKGGEKIILGLTTDTGMTREFEIDVVTENTVVLGGKTLITVPMEGDGDEIYTYSPATLGQDGEPMDREVTFSIISIPENITFDDTEKTFTLTSESSEGVIVVKAASKTMPSISETYRITVEQRRLEYIKYNNESDITVVIPDSGSHIEDVTAYVYDQADIRLKTPVTYKVTDEEGNIKENVTAVNGKLNISSSAYEGTAKIKASADNDRLNTERKLNLSYTDNRKLIEDYNYIIRINNFSAMKTNADFPSTGLYGSTISYKSSNTSVIDDNGVLTRDYTKDTSAILTITLTLNDAYLRKSVNVIALKEDNIADNGDIETGTTENWSGESLTVTDDAKSGDYALSAPKGAETTVTLKADRTYAVTVYVKSANTDKISLKVNGNTLLQKQAFNSYNRLDGIFTLSKNSDGITTVAINGQNLKIDDLIIFEITREYSSLIELIATAESTRTQKAVDAAKAALNNFYDLSVKSELLGRINAIEIKNSVNTDPGGGTTGGKGPSVSTPSTPTGSVPDYSDIVEYASLTFKDLNGHWAKDDVEYMASLGFVKGKEKERFDPDANITRAEFTALLVRTMGLSETEYENSFFDIVGEDWFSGSVQTARDKGYIMGSNGLFRPYDLITREEMTKMIVSAYNGKTGKALESGKAIYYNDVYSISSWAYDYIALACEEGLVNGVTETIFAPKAQATRAQAAVMLKRMYDKFTAE